MVNVEGLVGRFIAEHVTEGYDDGDRKILRWRLLLRENETASDSLRNELVAFAYRLIGEAVAKLEPVK